MSSHSIERSLVWPVLSHDWIDGPHGAESPSVIKLPARDRPLDPLAVADGAHPLAGSPGAGCPCLPDRRESPPSGVVISRWSILSSACLAGQEGQHASKVHSD